MPVEAALKIGDQADLTEYVRSCGADLVGWGDVSEGLAGELTHLPAAISLAMVHPPAGNVVRVGGRLAYDHRSTSLDHMLEGIQKNLVREVKSHGYRALAIPPDTRRDDRRFIARLFPLFPHKTAATCAGLGWIGKNGLLINERYGSRLAWATVLTNAPLPVHGTPVTAGRCGACRRCVEACPAQALSDREWVRSALAPPQIDVRACSGYLMENQKVLGRALCGLCLMACPYNKRRG